MKLHIMSDAHMQVNCGFGRGYGSFHFPVVALNLVLLGGMGRICDIELQEFIILQLKRFEHVFYVMGMDEFYQSTVAVGRQQMQEFAEGLLKSPPKRLSNGEPVGRLGTFHYLHRTRVDIEDVTILGCTLWRGWGEKSSQSRSSSYSAYRPIEDFYAEEEIIERALDIEWLQSQLEACASGETVVSTSRKYEATVTPRDLERPSVDPIVASTEKGDIYEDAEMTSPGRVADLPGDKSSENVPPTDQPPPEPSGLMSTSAPSSTQARRVIILTAHPPTFNETTNPYFGPATQEQTKEAAVVLQGRQCWTLDSDYGNGVVVSSPLHGSDNPRPRNQGSMRAEVEQMDTEFSETPSCGHNNGFTGDPYRPPGVALWAFGYTEWSCDTVHVAPVTMPANGPKGKKPDAAEQPANDNRCSQCNRVPAPIRLVSNQRGRQWERNLVPYVDAPTTWRAFDEAFVVDV